MNRNPAIERRVLQRADQVFDVAELPGGAGPGDHEQPRVVSVSRLHDAGWRPTWTNEEVLAALLEEVEGRHTVAGRRLGRKDATAAGAAGATVALLGTYWTSNH